MIGIRVTNTLVIILCLRPSLYTTFRKKGFLAGKSKEEFLRLVRLKMLFSVIR